ncbi:MAG: hypothetical protein SPI83_03920 [Rothia sp. (in: high G+C Gram-positive bacteria)]|nr:hypothetical protein [Rothia sp. (in: high G+C Gram-positive bacteria)]
MAFIGIGGWALLGAGKNRTYALTKDPYWMDYYLFALGPLGILFLGGGFYSLVRTDM